MAKSQPTVKEVTVSASANGSVKLIKYDVGSGFHFSHGQTWSIPDDWTDEEAEEFRHAKIKEFQEYVDKEASPVLNELIEQRLENNKHFPEGLKGTG